MQDDMRRMHSRLPPEPAIALCVSADDAINEFLPQCCVLGRVDPFHYYPKLLMHRVEKEKGNRGSDVNFQKIF